MTQDYDDDFSYNPESAQHADDAANRITEQGAYVGHATKAFRVVSSEKESRGIGIEFEAPGSGKTQFTFWLRNKEGKDLKGSGPPLYNAMLYLIGEESAKGEAGMVDEWDDAAKERVEVEGIVYPNLCKKPFGIVLKKELYTTKKGADAERFNLEAVFQAETRLTYTELKDKKVKPEKLDKILKSLKVKDARKRVDDEPAQPPLSGVDGI